MKMAMLNKIRHIVRLQQMLKRWRMKSKTAHSSSPPSDVPVGHVAIIIGPDSVRYVVRATYLNHPIFKSLLLEAEDAYGFSNSGPLTIPCDVSLFEEILRVVSRSDSWQFGLNLEEVKRCCRVSVRNNDRGLLGEAMPLMRG